MNFSNNVNGKGEVNDVEALIILMWRNLMLVVIWKDG